MSFRSDRGVHQPLMPEGVEHFYCGQLARPAGLIYSDFLDDYREAGGHKVRASDLILPPEWPRHVGLDFGAVNTATVWLAEDPAAKLYYVYHESLEGGKTTPDHAATLRKAAEGVNLAGVWGGARSESQQRQDWAAARVRVQEPPVSDVESGIDRVIELLKSRRLYISDRCRGILDELGTYRREIDETGQPTERIKDKERFHRLDALRYVVAGVTRKRSAHIG